MPDRKEGVAGMVNLEQCRKAELHSGNELVCEASVTAGPMGSILLDVPRSVAYGKDKPYLVKFYDPSLGVLTCRCVLSGPMDLPEDMLSLRCDIVEQLEQLQRREDVKVTVNVPIMLHAERRPGELYIPLKGWPAMVRNISAGGVYVSTDLSLSAGREIEFEFNETGEKVHLMARILRVEDLTEQPNQPIYGYGCKFVCLSARSENQLRNYVFREERRRRSSL